MKGSEQGGGGAPFPRMLDERVEGARLPEEWVRTRAAALLESEDPFHVPTGRKQRLLLSLGHGRVGHRFGWLRPVVAATFLLGGGAISSAALTKWPARLAHSCRQLFSDASPGAAPARTPPRRISLTAPAATPDAIAAPARASVPAPRAVAVARHAHRDARVPEDPALVVAATRALRQDRDPGRARALATQYLSAHPGGALAEEALAIAIEAALQHHDGDAATLGARYLRLYPSGSFRATAERGLAAPGSRAPQSNL